MKSANSLEPESANEDAKTANKLVEKNRYSFVVFHQTVGLTIGNQRFGGFIGGFSPIFLREQFENST